MGTVLLNITVSLDGFVAGPGVGIERPMGEGGERLHEWLFNDDADRDVDAGVHRELSASTGAVVVGRRTFDVGVGLWKDTPFPVPCFVLTHEDREELPMKSGTFTFVSDSLESAIRQARKAAKEKDVLVMGGADIAGQLVRAGLVDEIQLQLAPVLLGAGTRLFDHPGGDRVELERTGLAGSARVTHLRFRVVRQGVGAAPTGVPHVFGF
ncbi:dihydrofolate reductase family protein [Streptosporangium sp. NPDC023825]|uniref:dihydrofolate reductase family protein n=1 Tax=Streptosporangium sp. NPDC023825 TaxID=3154909 RepID=UPI003435F923